MNAREEPAAPHRDPKRPHRLAPRLRQHRTFEAGERDGFTINT